MIYTDDLVSCLRAFIMCVFLLPAFSVTRAANEYLSTEPLPDANRQIVVQSTDSVLFEVHSNNQSVSCSGTFTNAVGEIHKSFSSSLRVRFQPAAEGKANVCTIRMTTKGKQSNEPPASKTVVVYVIVPSIESRTLRHAPDGTPDDRTTVGIGEQVMLTLQPKEVLMDSDVKWSMEGDPSLTNSTGVATIFTAEFPEAPKTHAKIKGKPGLGGPGADVQKNSKPIVVTFDDGAPKILDNRRPVESDNKTPRLLPVENGSAKRAKEYAEKLEKINQSLKTNSLIFESALAALASMKTKSLMIDDQRSPAQEQSEELKVTELSLTARMLAKFYQPLDPKFDPNNRPSRFVRPPKGSTINQADISNIAPESIQEPALRKQYERALAANDARIKAYEVQYQRHDEYEIVQRYAVYYLKDLIGKSELRLAAFRRSMIKTGMDEKASEEVIHMIKHPNLVK